MTRITDGMWQTKDLRKDRIMPPEWKFWFAGAIGGFGVGCLFALALLS